MYDYQPRERGTKSKLKGGNTETKTKREGARRKENGEAQLNEINKDG